MRQSDSQPFSDHLRSRRRAKKLTTSSGRRAGLAGGLGGVFKIDLAMGVTGANRLNLPCVFAVFQGKVTPLVQ
ncbi:hypothetical protein GCM10025858_34280 [Alicyclobacillus sacchari]|nr:hypothetical protein GCM10025858_34280 [Alicyclobacillus sacchari]